MLMLIHMGITITTMYLQSTLMQTHILTDTMDTHLITLSKLITTFYPILLKMQTLITSMTSTMVQTMCTTIHTSTATVSMTHTSMSTTTPATRIIQTFTTPPITTAIQNTMAMLAMLEILKTMDTFTIKDTIMLITNQMDSFSDSIKMPVIPSQLIHV